MDREPLVGVSADQPSSPSATVTIVWVLVAILGHLALLDAAVETFWSGSPLRWWIAPSLLVFVALSIWLWRPGGGLLKRYGPAGAAAMPLVGLATLLAITAWLPAGQTDGVRMLGRSTSTVLVASLAAILVLAAYVTMRGVGFLSPAPRLATRSVFILLAIYALAGLGVAIRDHATFASLFQGEAVWQHLPRWLQGTFIGGLVLLPLAILVQLVRIIEHLHRKESVGILIHQTTALVVALVMATSGVILPGAGVMRTGRPSDGEGAAPAPVLTYEQWRKESPFEGQDPVALAERFSRAADEELKRPGADPSDIAAKAAALGGNAQKIFEFLRDQVTLEPYSGVLRGARGTLAAGAGNAVDRALLAQALLKAAGVESRLVRGRLSEAQTQTLLARYLAMNPVQGALATSVRQAGSRSVQADGADVAAKAGLPPDRVDLVLRRANARADAFWSKADEERAAQFDLLAGELRRGGVAPPAGGTELGQLRERLRDHYWLQVKDAQGSWNDFDPSFADAARGAVFASGADVLSKIPDDRFHRFEFSLVYWTMAQGKRRQEVLLKAASDTADALFAPLDFRIQPVEVTAAPNAVIEMDAAQKIEAIRNVKKFQGILRAGSKVTGGRPFDLKGHTFDQETAGPSANSIGGLMGGMFGLGGEEAPADFTELQVVLRLTGPGREPMTQTRALVRATDLQAPTFAPPLMEWEILVQPQWISADLAGYQVLGHLLSMQKAIAQTVKAGPRSKPLPPPPPLPQQLLQLAVLRQGAVAGILAKQPDVRALVDEPMLTIAGYRISALRAQEGRIDVERTIDIVENAVRYIPKDDHSQAAAFDAAVRQGVADCTLEHRFLQEAFPQATVESGMTVLARAQLERRALVLAAPREADKLRGAGMTDADVEWIRANERPAARLLVAKAAAGPAAWWSVRPNGSAVLRVSGGQGQGHTEHEVDVMLISLKVMFGMICGYEVVKAGQGDPSGMKGWKIAFCAVAAGGSLGFVMAGLHSWSWALICLEVGEFIISGISESGE